MILPELEEQLEAARISWPTHLRPTTVLRDIVHRPTPIQAKSKKKMKRGNDALKQVGGRRFRRSFKLRSRQYVK